MVGEARATVVDVLRANGIDPAAVSAVGRLDYETSGLLLCTSDGTVPPAYTTRVSPAYHPRTGVVPRHPLFQIWRFFLRIHRVWVMLLVADL